MTEKYLNSIMVASGEYLPKIKVTNADIPRYREEKGFGRFFVPIEKGSKTYKEDHLSIEERVQKFENTGAGMNERSFAEDNEVASDLAAKALLDTNYDLDSLDMIIVAHNFGDIESNIKYQEQVPNLGARVKYKTGIKDPKIVAMDINHGCPGWVQASITADAFLKLGRVKRIATIGTETLTRVADPYNIDWLLFVDAAGAVIWESKEDKELYGFLVSSGITDSENFSILDMGPSCNPEYEQHRKFMRMRGNELFKYASRAVPPVLQENIEKTKEYLQKHGLLKEEDKLTLDDIDIFSAHQMNRRMLCTIMEKAGLSEDQIKNKLPLIMHLIANPSDASSPILYNRIVKNMVPGFKIRSDDLHMHWAIGAGPHIAAFSYLVPK